MKYATSLGIAIAGLLAAVPAMADEATNDLHCYIVSLQMVGNSGNATVQMAGMLAHGYWLGKIDSLIPQSELTDRIVAETATMTNPAIYSAEAKRCGQEMVERGKAEAEMGRQISARGQEMMRQENSR